MDILFTHLNVRERNKEKDIMSEDVGLLMYAGTVHFSSRVRTLHTRVCDELRHLSGVCACKIVSYIDYHQSK